MGLSIPQMNAGMPRPQDPRASRNSVRQWNPTPLGQDLIKPAIQADPNGDFVNHRLPVGKTK